MFVIRKSRRWWACAGICCLLALIGVLQWGMSPTFRLWMMGVDVTPLKDPRSVAIGFRCRDKDIATAIDLVERILERRQLSVDSVHVLPPVGDPGLEAICQMKKISSVPTIKIYSSHVSNSGLRSLIRAANATKLVIQARGIDCAGVEHLLRMKSLESVDLTASGINDECLMSFGTLPLLKFLGVSETKVSRNGIIAFEKAYPSVRVAY